MSTDKQPLPTGVSEYFASLGKKATGSKKRRSHDHYTKMNDLRWADARKARAKEAKEKAANAVP